MKFGKNGREILKLLSQLRPRIRSQVEHDRHPRRSSNLSILHLRCLLLKKAKTTIFLDLISHLPSMLLGGLGKVEGGASEKALGPLPGWVWDR